jgi:hypothetical protein
MSAFQRIICFDASTGLWRLRLQIDADLPHGQAQRPSRCKLCRKIPDVAGYRSARTQNAAHLGKGRKSIRDEIHNQRRGDDFESRICERQRLRIRDMKRRPLRYRPALCMFDLRFGRVGREDRFRCIAVAYQFSKNAGPAADIQPLQMRTERQPWRKTPRPRSGSSAP